MEDCENIKFYSPEDTFGGVVKPQVCFTSIEDVPQDLKEPTDVVDIEVIYDPKAIHIYNKEVTVSCAEDTVPNQFSTITIAANTEKDVIKNSYLATIPSHNSTEAIEAAKIISLIIFYARQGVSKHE